MKEDPISSTQENCMYHDLPTKDDHSSPDCSSSIKGDPVSPATAVKTIELRTKEACGSAMVEDIAQPSTDVPEPAMIVPADSTTSGSQTVTQSAVPQTDQETADALESLWSSMEKSDDKLDDSNRDLSLTVVHSTPTHPLNLYVLAHHMLAA